MTGCIHSLIRTIEGHDIYLTEGQTPKFERAPIYLMVSIFGFLIAMGSIFSWLSSNYSHETVIIPLAISSIIFMIVMISFIWHIMSFVPAYFVITKNKSDCHITKPIVKTTSEQDQISICKATKEIEEEIYKNIQESKRLQEIANKCK